LKQRKTRDVAVTLVVAVVLLSSHVVLFFSLVFVRIAPKLVYEISPLFFFVRQGPAGFFGFLIASEVTNTSSCFLLSSSVINSPLGSFLTFIPKDPGLPEYLPTPIIKPFPSQSIFFLPM